MNKITMLGTGNALVSSIYNTCFVRETDNPRLLVDAGGGNGIRISLRTCRIHINFLMTVMAG